MAVSHGIHYSYYSNCFCHCSPSCYSCVSGGKAFGVFSFLLHRELRGQRSGALYWWELLKDTSVGGVCVCVCVPTSSPSIRVIKPKSLLLLFPNKPLRHKASLCDESVETKRQNLIFFHLSPLLLLSLDLSANVFPRRNNWHSSPSRGK